MSAAFATPLPNVALSSINRPPLAQILASLELVCAATSPVPVLMVFTVALLRHGLSTPVVPLAKMAGVSLLVLNVGAFASKRRWMFSGATLTLLTLLGVCLIGLSKLALSPATAWTLFGTGLLLALTNLIAVWKRMGLFRTTALLLLGLALGVYSESTYWRSGGEHLIAYREAMLGGLVHPDILQQAGIVNMIDTYGVASTGLDGVVPMKYHTGSLWAAQALRRLCGFEAIDFIAYGFGILLVPLYLTGVFVAAATIRAGLKMASENRPPIAFWLATGICVIGFFPFMMDPNHWNFNETILNSDSVLFAYGFSAWLIATAASFYFSLRPERTITFAERLTLMLAVPTALGLAGFIKISQVYLLLSILFYLCWRVKSLRIWPILAGLGISLIVTGAELRIETGAVAAGFAPFRFDRIHPEWVPYFFVVYPFMAWLFLFLWARMRNVRTLGDLVEAARSGETIPVEIIFVTLVAGLIPYLLMDFYSPAWKYFTEFFAVVATIFIGAFVPRFELPSFAADLRAQRLSLASCFGIFLLVALIGHLFMTTEGSLYRMLKSAGEARAVIAGKSPLTWMSQLRQIRQTPTYRDPTVVARSHMLTCLQSLNDRPRDEKKMSALYIPKTNRLYWDMRQIGIGATPFIAPAESGIAMIDGVAEFEDLGYASTGWGYPQYKLPTVPELPANHLADATQKARAEGFRVLWVMDGSNSAACDLTKIPLS
jgi:hypothetical protein